MTKEEKWINFLVKTATNHNDDEVAGIAMTKLQELNPTYHWCYEWDSLAICDKDPEWEACNCTIVYMK